MKEIELRFQVPPAQWEAVHRWVHGDDDGAGTGAHQERLRASYFDTPERHLAQAGYALRLRLEGDTWVQTLKGAAPDGMTRLEHNVPVNDAVPATVPMLDLSRHADHPAGQGLMALLERLGQPALLALFRTDIERLSRAFGTPHGEVELALDQGALLAGEFPDERRTPVAELEIELKQGDPRAVLEVARDWAIGQFRLTLELRTKALRGDLLARGEAAARVQASAPAVWRAGQSQAQALATLLQSVVEPVIGNASQILTGIHQPEHLHQLRVALRRLRVGVELLAAVSPAQQPSAAADTAADNDAPSAAQSDARTDAQPDLAADLWALRSLAEGARQLGRLLTAARDADAQAQAPWRQDLAQAWQQATLAVPVETDLAAPCPRPLDGPPPSALLADPVWQGWMLSIVAWLVRGWPMQGPIEAVVPEVTRLGDKSLHLARRFDKLDVEGRHQLRRRLRRWKMALEMTGGLKANKASKADNADAFDQAAKADHVAKAAKTDKALKAGPAVASDKGPSREVAKQMSRVQAVQKPLGELNDLEMGLVQARAALVRAVAGGRADDAARAAFELAWLLPVRDAALGRMRRRVKRLKR